MKSYDFKRIIEETEKSLIKKALAECNYHQGHAAKMLNLTPRKFDYKMHKYDLKG